MRWLALLCVLVAGPAAAQSAAERVFRLGHLAHSTEGIEYTRRVTLAELAKLGFVEGRNLVVFDRVGDEAAMPRLVEELLRTKPDAIIAIGPNVVRRASEATKTVPIVAFGPGIAESPERPGGNVTGVVILAAELDAKRLDILQQALPGVRRVAVLMIPSAPQRATSEQRMRKFAAEAGITLQVVDVAGPAEYPAAFAAMRAGRAEALVVAASALLHRDRVQIAALALDAKLPTVCEWADMAVTGCLLGYGPNRTELRRRVAHLVGQIFRGVSPADLPIETPAHFEFAINLKTARALGIRIAPEMTARADSVIE